MLVSGQTHPKPLLFKFGAARLQVEILFVRAGDKPVGVRQRRQIQTLPGDLDRKIDCDPAEEVELELAALKFDQRLGRPAVEGCSIAFQNAHFNKGRGAGGLTQNKYRNEVAQALCNLSCGCCPVLSGEQAIAKHLDLVTKGNPKLLKAQLGERDLLVSDRLAKTYPARKLERLGQRH